MPSTTTWLFAAAVQDPGRGLSRNRKQISVDVAVAENDLFGVWAWRARADNLEMLNRLSHERPPVAGGVRDT
jgi:hypothetical protein